MGIDQSTYEYLKLVSAIDSCYNRDMATNGVQCTTRVDIYAVSHSHIELMVWIVGKIFCFHNKLYTKTPSNPNYKHSRLEGSIKELVSIFFLHLNCSFSKLWVFKYWNAVHSLSVIVIVTPLTPEHQDIALRVLITCFGV